MSKIIAIAAVESKFGALGYRGKLLYKNKADMQRFKRLTTSNIVVAGPATVASLGAKWPMPGRALSLVSPPTRVSRAEMAEYVRKLRAHAAILGCDVYVIGGGKTYSQWLEYCDYLDLTLVHDMTTPVYDCLFPIAKARALFARLGSSSVVRNTDTGLAYEYSLWSKKHAVG